jgi:hypothetical protein
MEEYYKSQDVEWRRKKNEIRFIFAGKSLRETQAAGELKMQGGDVIEARHGKHDSNVISIPLCFPRLLWYISPALSRMRAHTCARMEYGVVDQHINQ